MSPRVLIFILSYFPIFNLFAQVEIETGVSEKLASYRKEVLSNVHYSIRLIIPSSKTAPIEASETIRFKLKKNGLPLQIDFKEEKDHVKSISVNQKYIPIVFEKEHIIIGPEYLEKGINAISINFIAGDLSLNRNDDCF